MSGYSGWAGSAFEAVTASVAIILAIVFAYLILGNVIPAIPVGSYTNDANNATSGFTYSTNNLVKPIIILAFALAIVIIAAAVLKHLQTANKR